MDKEIEQLEREIQIQKRQNPYGVIDSLEELRKVKQGETKMGNTGMNNIGKMIIEELTRLVEEESKQADTSTKEGKDLRTTAIVMKLLLINAQQQDVLEEAIQNKQARLSRQMNKESVQALIKVSKSLIETETEALQLLEELATLVE